MQFNTRYLRALEQRYGITPEDVAVAGCYPFELAAWRLQQHMRRDRGDLWTRLANYHSRTPHHNAKYRAKLIRAARRWAARLRAWGLTAKLPAHTDVADALQRGDDGESRPPRAGASVGVPTWARLLTRDVDIRARVDEMMRFLPCASADIAGE